jgi:hypothetical protein
LPAQSLSPFIKKHPSFQKRASSLFFIVCGFTASFIIITQERIFGKRPLSLKILSYSDHKTDIFSFIAVIKENSPSVNTSLEIGAAGQVPAGKPLLFLFQKHGMGAAHENTPAAFRPSPEQSGSAGVSHPDFSAFHLTAYGYIGHGLPVIDPAEGSSSAQQPSRCRAYILPNPVHPHPSFDSYLFLL